MLPIFEQSSQLTIKATFGQTTLTALLAAAVLRES
jgi:hypothetical protein